MPEASLDKELGCKHCRTAFVPRDASRQRGSEAFNAKPYYVGGGVLLLIVSIYLATRGGEPVKADTGPKEPPRRVLTGMDNPRNRDALDWARAIGAGDDFTVAARTDANAWSINYGIASVSAEGRQEIADKILTDEATHWFREFEFTSASAQPLDGANGTVTLYGNPRPEWTKYTEDRDYAYHGKIELSVAYRMQEGRAMMGLFTLAKEPRRSQQAKKAHKAHKEIGQAETVEREVAGMKFTAVEADPVPLDHFDDTPAALRAEIDQWIDQLVNHELPQKRNWAQLKLTKISKPAIPRLLNQLYEIKMDSKENVYKIRVVCQTLEQITGQRMGFTSAIDLPTGESTEVLRQSAIRQWFGYWTTHHDRENWDLAKEREESLEFPTDKPKTDENKKDEK